MPRKLRYPVYRSEASGAEVLLADVSADALGSDYAGVLSGQNLFYPVTAVNPAGESVWSNEAEIGVL